MARRWTPRRFVALRRIRVASCVAAVVIASVLSFGIGARKSVALEVNGQTRTVTTYAMSVDRLLQEQGVDVKTHDLVQSTSGTDTLRNHDVVTVRSAYQTTIVIDGTEVPFWTVATSADQLLGFFASSEADAAKVTVNIKNVYNQLTGGFVINRNGPVTVIADGKTSIAPDGKLPAASILDSKGITLGKEDRVSVEEDGGTTVLRVQRVTHGEITKTVPIPHGTQTVIDDSLAPGATAMRQQGEDGEKTETYSVTYVDGKAESETLTSSTVTKEPIDTVILVGPEQAPEPEATPSASPSETPSESATESAADGSGNGQSGSATPSATPAPSTQTPTTDTPTQAPSTSTPTDQPSTTPEPEPSTSTPVETPEPTTPAPSTPAPAPSTSTPPATGGDNGGNGGNDSDTPPDGLSREELETWYENHNRIPQADARLWHPTAAQAKAYARGAAAQRGWTGADWDALEILWTKESSWQWYADNPTSSAYGIPQGLPGWDMGYGWQDDGAVQIDWGLKYIAQRYGTPSEAWAYWQRKGWY